MVKEKRIKRLVTAVPKSLEEASQFLLKIAEEQRIVEKIQSELNAQVDKLKAEAMESMREHQERITALADGIYIYAEGHREELTEEGKRKTIRVPTGIFGWRITPPAVSLKNVKLVLENLKKLNLERFIKVKEEPDKEAMLREPELAEKIKGVSIIQREEFVVKPSEIEIEIIPHAKLKRESNTSK